jgi:hypothetical protein
MLIDILPKLTPDQRQMINGLSSEETGWAEEILDEHGEAYFLENFKPIFNQLEYIRTL